jgi:hypothetical protein
MPAIYNSAHGLRSNTEKQQQLGCWYEGRHSRSGSWRGGRGQARPASGRVRAPAPGTCTLRREPERLTTLSLCACMHARTQANERTKTQRQPTCPHRRKPSRPALPPPPTSPARVQQPAAGALVARWPGQGATATSPRRRRAWQSSRSTSIVLRERAGSA